jgi:hypothetical protein
MGGYESEEAWEYVEQLIINMEGKVAAVLVPFIKP